MSNNKFKLLVVEDEANIRSFIQVILEANDFKVITADTCAQGIMMFFSHMPDLVMLDLGLPDMDGLEFIRQVRQSSMAPIIILSARTQEADKVAALDMGANDYITKPFGTAELLARVRAALRSSIHTGAAGMAEGSRFCLRDMTIDYNRRLVSISGREIRLTQTEYNIVALLSRHAGKIMTYSAIIQAIWGAADHGSTKKLQVNMANIRKKLGVRPGENRYITNELGVGYRMYDEDER
jgi:two-component system KDP operon response regulator KdpE